MVSQLVLSLDISVSTVAHTALALSVLILFSLFDWHGLQSVLGHRISSCLMSHCPCLLRDGGAIVMESP